MEISTREEYDYCVARGYEPLRDMRFPMDINLRKEIQEEKFGKGNHRANNMRFYRYAWGICKDKVCEECRRPLYEFSPTFISHILSRGAHPACAYDCRNFNLLCLNCHSVWENGDRENMRIYTKNQEIIKALKKDYYGIGKSED